jgi:tripartite-type tricarboxylate transporter receptor subunit TctC
MLARLKLMAVLTAALVALPGGAMAQSNYPDRPITIVVSSAVGGSIDGLARQLAPYWEKALGGKINVENHEGAGGVVGVRYFLEQPDDGYTILICTEAHYTATVEKTGTVKTSDIELINMQQFTPTTWYVLENSRFKTLEDVIKEGKEKPDTITWGAPPTGNSTISAGVVEKGWGVDLRYVPQETGAATDTALLGGHIDIKVGTAGDITEVEGIRGLAVASKERVAHLPDVPTFNEVGSKLGLMAMPDIGTGRLISVRASVKANHPEIFQRLAEAYEAAFNDPAYQEVLKSTGQANSSAFNEPDAATTQFRELVDNAIKGKKEFAVSN